MTRINLIDPEHLTDQHLIAEYRELPRIFALALKHNNSGKPMPKVSNYRMGSGHVIFFYDKILFLIDRQQKIINELLNRNFSIMHTEVDAPINDLSDKYLNNWSPSTHEISISKQRLKEKLLMRPTFYKHKSKPVGINFYD